MTKKIGLFILSVVLIFGISSSFADVIDPNTHYVNRCVKLQNVEVDNYRVIVENDTVTTRDVYEPQIGECLEQHYKFGESRQYLLDKSVNIEEITQENIQDMAIQIGNLKVNGYYVDDSNPLTNENFTYKIIKNGNNYSLEETENESVNTAENDNNNTLEEIVDENVGISGDKNDYTLEIVESEQGVELVSNNRLIKFGIAWIITILIEIIALFTIAKIFRKKDQISSGRLLLIGILASTITLPLLRFVLPLFVTNETIYVVVGELAVTLVEIFIIKYGLKISRGRAVLASVICNLCSFLFGLFIF